MAERGGLPAFKMLATFLTMGAGITAVGGAVFWLLPYHIARPGMEASPEEYSMAAAAADSDSYDSGKCPALEMDVARALSDQKLTKGEVHDLKVKARELGIAAEAAREKNAALIQFGQKPSEEEIDCGQGEYLFGY